MKARPVSRFDDKFYSSFKKFLQEDKEAPEETQAKIGNLTKLERQEKVRRYLEKKKRRKANKKIVRYACRKSLAESRVRSQGRFVKVEKSKSTRF